MWDFFLDHIKSVHGKIYGLIGVEVQNALQQYITNHKQPSIQEYETRIQTLEMENEQLKNLKKSLDKKTAQYDQLQNRFDKLRNKFDHLQERFNKSQKELVISERENSNLRVTVAKIEKLSFWERLLNRLPEEVKQLSSLDGK